MLTKDEVREIVQFEVRDIVRQEFALMSEQLHRMDHHITGNGTPERGVLIRMDRLEQEAERRKWLARATIGTVIGALTMSVFALFK
jgi:hypothetical protein